MLPGVGGTSVSQLRTACPACLLPSGSPRPALGHGLVLNGGVKLPFPVLPRDPDTQERQQIRQICNHHLNLTPILEFLCLGNEGVRTRSFRVILKACRRRGPTDLSRDSEDYLAREMSSGKNRKILINACVHFAGLRGIPGRAGCH